MSAPEGDPVREVPVWYPAYRRAGRVRRWRLVLERTGAQPLEHEVTDVHDPRAWLDDLAHQLMDGDTKPGDRLTLTLLSEERRP